MSSRPPKGLRSPGRALWKAVLGDLAEGWELTCVELHLLGRACRCADELAELEAAIDRDGATVKGSRGQTVAHPALSEARQLRLAQLRLLGEVKLPDAGEVPRSQAGLRGQKAARSRWDRRDAVEARRGALRGA